MIDRPARRQLAEAIRALVSGQISNDEFEDRVSVTSQDPAVHEVFESGAWGLYSDTHEYHLKGRYKLARADKSHVARWVLFLQTDLPYEWPRLRGWQQLAYLLGSLATLGIAARVYRSRWRRRGDFEVWPFIRTADLRAARRNPAYLAGL
jgi:hypothetical protein